MRVQEGAERKDGALLRQDRDGARSVDHDRALGFGSHSRRLFLGGQKLCRQHFCRRRKQPAGRHARREFHVQMIRIIIMRMIIGGLHN